MVLLVGMGVLVLSPGISTLIDQRRQIAELEASVKASNKAVKEIEAERDRWKDPAFVRAQARDRLFFVMPGETQLSVIQDIEIPASVKKTSSTQLTTVKQDWLKNIAGSLLSAGTTSATPEEPKP